MPVSSASHLAPSIFIPSHYHHKTMTIKLSPSILSADFSRLGEQVREATAVGVEYIHVDVMDGHFVPNITIGPVVVKALRPIADETGAKLDVHLMIEQPSRYLAAFAQAGADIITIHVETCPHLHNAVQQIRSLGASPGVTLNPATPLATLEEILPYVDQVLIMSVNPGFSGQSYIPASTDKIARLRQMLVERGLERVRIEVDGGVKPSNIAEIAAAGAELAVAGSAVYNQKASVAENIAALRRAAMAGR